MFGWNPTRIRELLRLATFWAIAIWQGGFVFYSGFVVKIGSWELKSDLEQGFITRRVTLELERLGWIALVIWGLTLVGTRFTKQQLRWTAFVLWSLILALHIALHFQWYAVDRLLDVESRSILEPESFYQIHRVFMITASVQWLLVVVLSGVTLQAWQRERSEENAEQTGRPLETNPPALDHSSLDQ